MTNFRRVWAFLDASHRREAVLLAILMTIAMLLEMLGVGLVLPAIGLLSGSAASSESPWFAALKTWLGNPSDGMLMVLGLYALLFVYFVKTIFVVFLMWRQAVFVASVQSSLSQRLFSLYLRQPWTFHLQRNSTKLIHHINGEVSHFAQLCAASLSFVTEAFVIFGVLALLLFIAPSGAILIAISLGLATYGFQLLSRRRLESWGTRLRSHELHRFKHLNQGLGGVKDVKLFGREAEFIREFKTHDIQVARLRSRVNAAQQLPRLWYELLAVAGLAMLGTVLVIQGNTATQVVGRIGLFAAAAFRVLPSANRMLMTWQYTRSMKATLDSLAAELTLLVADEQPADATPLPFADRIVFAGVTYSYPGVASPTLKNVTLSIPKGKSLGVIGESGAGKSTLVDTLLGLLTPQEGVVTIDGRDIRTCLRAWQNAIGYVPQSIYLTDDSIRRNVAFGVPENEIDDVAVRRALQAAQLDAFVATLPDGENTLVGERGVRLSGGQRQRIGIARALYSDPLILVLDEATSALDTSTEADVMSAVNSLLGSKTIVIVAHRLSTLATCDQLVRLEHGEIVEAGSFAEVVTP